MPLLVRYDEAARGEIKHPFRVCISPGLSRNRLVWPARHAVYSGNPHNGLPMGARLRLKQSWYDANRATFSPINRAIIDAMRNYGVIVADLANGGFWLNGVNDERWNYDDLLKLRTVPVSAFEVLDTIKPPCRFTGPTAGRAGAAQEFVLQYLIRGDSNFFSEIYVGMSSDGGKKWAYIASSKFHDRQRGAFTFSFTPPSAGTYILRVDYGGNDWIAPPNITFTATAAARPRRSARPAVSRPRLNGPASRGTAPARCSGIRSDTLSRRLPGSTRIAGEPVWSDRRRGANRGLRPVYPRYRDNDHPTHGTHPGSG